MELLNTVKSVRVYKNEKEIQEGDVVFSEIQPELCEFSTESEDAKHSSIYYGPTGHPMGVFLGSDLVTTTSTSTETDRNRSYGMENMDTNNYHEPTEEDLEREEFNTVWNEIKSWDINVPEEYERYCGATGNHVMAILDALEKNNLLKKPEKINIITDRKNEMLEF